MGKLDEKVAIVTGAASGIGKATARLFSVEGAKVVVADWDEEAGAAVAAELRREGGHAIFVQADVSRSEDMQRMVQAALNEFGRIDILINNAGIEGQQAQTADATEENWDHVMEVNLKSVFLGMKYVIPQMLAQGGGAIVNNASVAGLVGFAGSPAYCASKGGIIQLTRVTALEYAARSIRVNCVCPGVILTPMVERVAMTQEVMQALVGMEPVGRLGRPEEIASAILFLASDEASYVTGAILPVDGGLVAR